MRSLPIVFLCAHAAAQQGGNPAAHLADLPDPLVGTGSTYELSRGGTYPGVFLPFAMTNWTAETGDGGWPYQNGKEKIRGFRATHRPSAWMNDWGSFSIMPMTGELRVDRAARASRYHHEHEQARPYRFSVLLEDYGIQAEMAPTQHGGILRFTFPEARRAWVLFDEASVQVDARAQTIAGMAANYKLYFAAVFDHPFAVHGASDKAAWVGFDTNQREAVTVRVGTSLIGIEQAKHNLEAEMPRPDFDAVAGAARAEWDRELGRIEVSGGTEDERRTLYTAMYHTLQFPHMLAEGGVHRSPYDGKIHPGPMISDTGFWDTFRAEFPLLALLQPTRDADMIRGMLNIFDESGWLPQWPNPAETHVMIGTHADSVIADAYAKGIRDYDLEKAWRAVYKDATESTVLDGRTGLPDYVTLGYVPADHGIAESVSRTLEYAYDDACVARLAQALGKSEESRKLCARAQSYRNVFDTSTGFMRGRRADGSWTEPFDPLDWGGVFTEGNAWQWLWSVQHDVPGLMQLLGGRDAFVNRLDTFFSMTSDYKVGAYRRVIHEMTETKLENMGQYAHVNEPVHHVIYLYDYAGQPWKAQKWVHEVMTRLYKPGPDGWLGDEDTGQMSAWYIFGAMGFYPADPGRPIYALGTPLFDRLTIHLENRKTFTVEAARRQPGDIYVQSATLNGQPLDRPWIAHAEIVRGGVLRFVLGPQPNQKWATGGIPAN